MLSPYLIDGSRLSDPHLVVREEPQPINGAPPLIIGSKPIDGGHYIFTEAERGTFLEAEPGAAPFMRPYIGAEELINGGGRYILALQQATPTELRRMPLVRERVERVQQVRRASASKPTQQLGDTPTRYHVNVIPERPFLAIPEVSSERRQYVPLAFLEPPIVPSNLVRVLLDADFWHFGVLTSAMHTAWLREIGGKLKSDYRYSISIVYNTFPWPEADEAARERVRGLAGRVLAARVQFPAASLADLYDPLLMPPVLRQAHRTLDAAVERLYRVAPFTDDRERVEHLLMLYELHQMPLLGLATAKRRGRRG